jgi:hypothetical protein
MWEKSIGRDEFCCELRRFTIFLSTPYKQLRKTFGAVEFRPRNRALRAPSSNRLGTGSSAISQRLRIWLLRLPGLTQQLLVRKPITRQLQYAAFQTGQHCRVSTQKVRGEFLFNGSTV